MQRAIGALVGALLLASLTAGPTFAWPQRLDGRPEQFEVGGDSAYYVWTDGEDDFHLATTGPGPRRKFVAVIHTDGEITDVDQVRLEGDDSFRLEDGGRKLVVRFETFGQADSIQWKVRGGQHGGFNLRVDGHPIRPVNVYLGREGDHPLGPIFRIHR